MEAVWNDFVAYLQAGFAQVNVLQGLLIALIAAFMMHQWSSVIFFALGATVVHILVDVMVPVLANGAPFRLPPLVEGDYWRYLLTLYVGYLLVITVFYIVKRMFMSASHSHA